MRLPSWTSSIFTPRALAYAVVAVIASAPAWIVKYPPIQDLPFHLATIRIVHSFHDPAFAFDGDFVLTLGRTQYVLYYLVASFLSNFVGVKAANIVLMSAYLAGTPLALRALLRALGKDERLCLFVVPLLPNVMFLFGLFPFLLGIPIMLWAIAVAVEYVAEPTWRRGVLLGALTLGLFYSHVFPFGIFGLAFVAIFPWREPRRWITTGLPTVPALLALAWWTLFTDAGKLTRGVLTDGKADAVQPLNAALPGAFQWLTDVFHDTSDEAILIALVVVAALTTAMAQGDTDRSRPVSRLYGLVPIACILAYFTMGQGHGYIWLISQRFPILCLITAIPFLRMPHGWRGVAATAAACGVALASTVNVCRHFVTFQLDEVGDLDAAIAAMAPRKHVAALIFDRGSAVTNWAPFLHYGSYYQLEKGGVVEFTYAGYAHWPIDFKPGHYPPPGTPARLRWEWTPEQVSTQELVPYYDYVLVRGSGFHPPSGTFNQVFHGAKWSVWEKAAAR